MAVPERHAAFSEIVRALPGTSIRVLQRAADTRPTIDPSFSFNARRCFGSRHYFDIKPLLRQFFMCIFKTIPADGEKQGRAHPAAYPKASAAFHFRNHSRKNDLVQFGKERVRLCCIQRGVGTIRSPGETFRRNIDLETRKFPACPHPHDKPLRPKQRSC